MADLRDMDIGHLEMIRSTLLERLASYRRLEKTEQQRAETAYINDIFRELDKAMDDAYTEHRAMVAGANQLHFENVKEGRI
jgi:metal-responsive CopG/Arc/MetJ family transcriptional regulator